MMVEWWIYEKLDVIILSFRVCESFLGVWVLGFCCLELRVV